MTTKQLIEKLQALPADMEVMIIQYEDEGAYSMVESCEVQSVKFSSPDVPKKEWCNVDCVVISDN